MLVKRVPVIDIKLLGSRSPRHDETITGIGTACREYGFFHITGHGIPADLIERVWRETKRFFTLPLDAKQAVSRSKENARGWYNRELTKNTRDMKEVFDFGHAPHPELPDDDPANWTQDGFNRWPDARLCPEFRATMQEYFRACERVAFTLLEAIAESLGVPPDQLTRDFVGRHTSFVRLNYYPCHDPLCTEQPASATGHLGIHPHTDAGALTVLLHDEVSALEINRDGQWILVEPVIGALVVNIGDIVQVWSNDRYPAPLHRVRASTNRERYSLPFFFNPVYEAIYAPLEALTNDQSPPRYRPITWGNFRWKRQQGDYADYGSENQISDYPHSGCRWRLSKESFLPIPKVGRLPEKAGQWIGINFSDQLTEMFGHWRLRPLTLVISARTQLQDHDLMPFDGILQSNLVLKCAGLRFRQNAPTICSIRLRSSSLNVTALIPRSKRRTRL